MAINSNEIYHLARLALGGTPGDVQMYIKRLAVKLESTDRKLSEKLGRLRSQSETVWRKRSPVPVDSDSHLQLVRVEDGIELEIEPILQPPTDKLIEQLILERGMIDQLIGQDIVPTKSALFVGKPGVGKTMTARWIAARINKTLVTLDLSAVISSYLGKTGSNLRNVLDFAKQQDCILLLDEFDAIAKKRDDESDIGELKRLVTVLLQEVDQWPYHGLLIAATNHGELLDPAVWRRFDMLVEFPMPTLETAEDILRMYWGGHDQIDENIMALLALLWKDQSPSELARQIAQIRRQAAVFNKPPLEVVLSTIESYLADQDKDVLKKMVPILVNNGYSQRKVSELTGLARNTVSKALASK